MTGDIYLVGMNDINDPTPGDLELYKYTASTDSWSTKPNIIQNTDQITQPGIFIDEIAGNLWIAYPKATGSTTVADGSLEVVFRVSKDDGETWSPETKFSLPGEFPADYRNLSTNFYGNQTFYVTWYDRDDHQFIGQLAVNIIPLKIYDTT